MGATTGIQWTDATWNPIGGCSIKSPGCTNCYAQSLAGTRLYKLPLYAGTTTPSKAGPVFNGHLTRAADDAAAWTWPVRWRGTKNPVLGPGRPSTIFVGDMADLFHEDRPRDDIDRAVAAIIYSRHIGQLLTKRANVMRDYFVELRESGRWMLFPHPLLGKPNFAPEALFETVMARLWLGVSVEDQPRADERIPLLLDTPAAVRFISAEPLLGPVDIREAIINQIGPEPDLRVLPCLDWIVAGGESGPNARPMHPAWARSLRDQCQAAGAAFFFKQWGEFAPAEIVPIAELADDARPGTIEPCNDSAAFAALSTRRMQILRRVGKRAAGRLLDGREWSEFPEPHNIAQERG